VGARSTSGTMVLKFLILLIAVAAIGRVAGIKQQESQKLERSLRTVTSKNKAGCDLLGGVCVNTKEGCDKYGEGISTKQGRSFCKVPKKYECCYPHTETGCPEDFHKVDSLNKCVLPLGSELSFKKAKNVCKRKGLDLLQPDDPITMRNFIKQNFNGGSDYVWFDGRGDGSNIVTSKGQAISNDDPNWNEYAYSHRTKDSCLYMDVTQGDLPYEVSSCSNEFRTFCEMPVSPAAVTTKECPATWEATGQGCYKFLTDWVTRTEAEAACNALDGAKLAVLDTEEKRVAMSEYFVAKGGRFDSDDPDGYWFFVGAGKVGDKYMWDGTTVEVEGWSVKENQPNEADCENCRCIVAGGGSVSGVGQNDIFGLAPCDIQYNALCEMPVTPTAVTTKVCDEGWVLAGQGCYTFVRDWLLLNEAESSCSSIGAKLAVLDTEEKRKDIYDYLVANGMNSFMDSFWVGAHHSFGSWYWDGTSVEVEGWAKDHPIVDRGDCVVLVTNKKSDQRNHDNLVATSCTGRYQSICEKN